MRKLASGNKIKFITFSIIIIIIIAIFLACLKIVLGLQKEEYLLESGTFIYDNENTPISIENEAKMHEKWNGSYYLKIDNAQERQEYDLGGQVVAYKSRKRMIDLYGKFYQIDLDGNVTKSEGYTEITDTSKDALYKLNDRKYLIISNNITNQTQSLNTKDYLIVILDKAGNALLLNNELNSKTIKPMIISTNSFKLDVANEKLIYNGNEIDLKKILGSTNQYKEKIKVENATNNIKEETGETIGGTTISNNQQTTTVQVPNASTGGDNSSSDNKSNTQEILPKSVTLKGISVNSSYVDIDYYIIDPQGKYQTVYLLVEGDISKTIALDKSKTTYRVTGLTQNTEYKITLGSKETKKSGEILDIIEDVVNIRTLKNNSQISITKVGIDKIYFNLKMDNSYIIDSGKVALYVDGQKISSTPINIEKSVTDDGWSSSIDYNYGNEIILKLEDTVYNGKKVEMNISTKIKNY